MCAGGFYLNENYLCLPCNTNCLICPNNSCVICTTGYSLNGVNLCLSNTVNNQTDPKGNGSNQICVIST